MGLFARSWDSTVPEPNMHFGECLGEIRGACGEIRRFDGGSSQGDFGVPVAGMFWIFFRLAFALTATCCD